MVSCIQSSILAQNSLGYAFQLLEFQTDKPFYLINETLTIHGEWNYHLDPGETGTLQYEIYSGEGALLNVSQNFEEQGLNLANNYSILLLDFNFKPQLNPENVIIYLHLAVIKNTGEKVDLFNSLSVAVGFFNLSVSCMLKNSTLLHYEDPFNLSLAFFERDTSHFPASNVSINFWIEDQEHKLYLLSSLATDEIGLLNLGLNIENLTPNLYDVKIETFNSPIFNNFSYSYPFIIFPGDLVALLTLDRSDLPVSIPDENIVTKNGIYLHVFHDGNPYSPPEFQLNWTFMGSSGDFIASEDTGYYAALGPITQLGNFPLNIYGYSSNFTNICLNSTINVIRRNLDIKTSFDLNNYSYALNFFDKETGIQISPNSIGSVKAYELTAQNNPVKLSLENSGNCNIISPIPIPQNETMLKILISVEENGNFSFYSNIFTAALSSGKSENQIQGSFNILIVLIILSGFLSCGIVLRVRKSAGIKLKSLKVDL